MTTIKEWLEIRKQVLERDKHTCQNCLKQFDSSKLDAHHIIPRRKQGLDSINNLFTFCESCHVLIELRKLGPRYDIDSEIIGNISQFKFIGRISNYTKKSKLIAIPREYFRYAEKFGGPKKRVMITVDEIL